MVVSVRSKRINHIHMRCGLTERYQYHIGVCVVSVPLRTHGSRSATPQRVQEYVHRRHHHHLNGSQPHNSRSQDLGRHAAQTVQAQAVPLSWSAAPDTQGHRQTRARQSLSLAYTSLIRASGHCPCPGYENTNSDDGSLVGYRQAIVSNTAFVFAIDGNSKQSTSCSSNIRPNRS